MSKKIQSILSLIEIAENNLTNARNLLLQLTEEKGISSNNENMYKNVSADESQALEVVEGYFDGENMIGDNGQIYTVPQNYASKTQLVIGDRMKWMLTPDREVFKLIGQASRERIIGTFSMENDNYVVHCEKFQKSIKILKASATFAMKNLGLNFGDEVVIIIPRGVTPTWGAFSSVVKTLSESEKNLILSSDSKPQDEDMDGFFDLSSKIGNSDYL
ncbi:MAG: hypothetical protein ACRCXZ_08980 [Patescibacteria group bacterium]